MAYGQYQREQNIFRMSHAIAAGFAVRRMLVETQKHKIK